MAKFPKFPECRVMRACEVVSTMAVEDGQITVGIEVREGRGFIILCVQDLAGCQHITTQTPGALALVEKLCQCLRLLPAA